MSNGKSKKEMFYVIVLILTMITMLVGITFTYFSLVARDKKDSTRVQTGTLSVDYVDGRTISSNLLFPINEPSLNSNAYASKKNFSVRNDGTLDQTFDIYVNVTSNQFQNNSLKFALYDETNTKIAGGSIPKSGRVLLKSDIYLSSNETKSYTVLIWLQENNENQDYEKGNTFTGEFLIEARQIKLN